MVTFFSSFGDSFESNWLDVLALPATIRLIRELLTAVFVLCNPVCEVLDVATLVDCLFSFD